MTCFYQKPLLYICSFWVIFGCNWFLFVVHYFRSKFRVLHFFWSATSFVFFFVFCVCVFVLCFVLCFRWPLLSCPLPRDVSTLWSSVQFAATLPRFPPSVLPVDLQPRFWDTYEFLESEIWGFFEFVEISTPIQSRVGPFIFWGFTSVGLPSRFFVITRMKLFTSAVQSWGYCMPRHCICTAFGLSNKSNCGIHFPRLRPSQTRWVKTATVVFHFSHRWDELRRFLIDGYLLMFSKNLQFKTQSLSLLMFVIFSHPSF